ncbi:MAG: hypothetical protein LBE18_03180 [Planctomycetaceae bacterium]|jgi:hypothetical protein|nr:hypothetical protein [Planctomycetaceae bacterium]
METLFWEYFPIFLKPCRQQRSGKRIENVGGLDLFTENHDWEWATKLNPEELGTFLLTKAACVEYKRFDQRPHSKKHKKKKKKKKPRLYKKITKWSLKITQKLNLKQLVPELNIKKSR